jgi:TIGR03009 family protein
LSTLLAAAPAAVGQAPTPPASPGQTPMNLANPQQLPGNNRAGGAIVPAAANVVIPPALQAHLTAWEKKSAAVTNYYSECDYVRKNTLTRKDTTFTGTMMCMKPNLARMRIDNKADKGDFLSYISDGKSVYEYAGKDKVIRQYAIPPGGKGGAGDNLLMEFMSGGMTADDVKQRFDLKLDKEEDHYVHIKITPRLDRDKQEFDTMLLVLYGAKLADRKWDYLPAVVMMSKNGGQEVEQWTFKEPKINHDGIKKEHFVALMPDKKDGWKLEQMSASPRDPRTGLTAAPPGAPAGRK